MNEEERSYLLKLARRSIQKYFTDCQKLIIDRDSFPYLILKEPRGVFITLTLFNKLRGCIGNLKPEQPLYQNVIDNSLAAAFCDPRFPPLSLDELPKIKIEISVLGHLKKIHFATPQELLNYLKRKKPGIFLKQKQHQATFLPQVWQELTDPREFLSFLCEKANLEKNAWQNPTTEIYEYAAEIIKENN